MAFDVTELPRKYDRPRETHRTGLTIWEVPGAGLYRVLETNRGEFRVQTLAPNGWIDLIILGKSDHAEDADAALQIWLNIQTPSEAPASKEST